MKQHKRVFTISEHSSDCGLFASHSSIEEPNLSYAFDLDEHPNSIVLTIEQLRKVYFDGFNQAHYSHVHPEIFPPKEIEQAASEYLQSKGITI